MAALCPITFEEVREHFRYDPETGVMTWVYAHTGVQAGQIAGSITGHKPPYREIRFRGGRYGAHRLAWLYVFGKFPVGYIDHINGDSLDNRIANLREATALQNTHNRGANSNNKLGLKGVVLAKDGWYRANITIAGRKTYLGSFPTAELAYAAYCKKAKETRGEFARVA